MEANPFEFEAANKFTAEQMVDYFIDDYNFSRFVQSQKNVFLLGDRGTGKTMVLRYYSLPVQQYARRNDPNVSELLQVIGIYIPCRKPALKKSEPEMLDLFLGRSMAEHLLVVAMVSALAESLEAVPTLGDSAELERVREEINFVLQWNLPPMLPVFRSLKLAAQRESTAAQRAMNIRVPDGHYENAVTFSTGFEPVVDVLSANLKALGMTHFSLMFDDADDLSDYQNQVLNSWIATRDTSKISFKVATSKVDQKPLKTSSGDGLLERHDFIRVDLEQEFQSSDAGYGKLAREIVNRRLEKFRFERNADEFFPINEQMAIDLKTAEDKARSEAEEKCKDDRTQIRHYVYKNARAIYFRERSARSNRPPYSGFDLLVHVSTGVIRYLLEPCYLMYDTVLSEVGDDVSRIPFIRPAIQTEQLAALSRRRWEWIREGFNNNVRDCTREDAHHIYQLVDQLAVLFKARLQGHASEPRAITFSISARASLESAQLEDLERILKIARRAQILFMRPSTAKVEGRQDDYYTFDRLLWIDRGLDPVGQNARVSIEARFLWEAAFKNQPLPFGVEQKKSRSTATPEHPDMFGKPI